MTIGSIQLWTRYKSSGARKSFALMSARVRLDHAAEIFILIAKEKSNTLLRVLIGRDTGDICEMSYCHWWLLWPRLLWIWYDTDQAEVVPRLVSSKFVEWPGSLGPVVTWCLLSVSDQHQPTQWHHAMVSPEPSHQPGPQLQIIRDTQ